MALPGAKLTPKPYMPMPTKKFGILQDKGVPGQTIGDLGPIPAMPQYGIGAGGTITTPFSYTPQTAQTPSQFTLPGYTPDYNALVRGDPLVLNSAADYNTNVGAVTQARMKAIRDAVTRAGFRMNVGGDVDQATIDAALGNKQSQAATLANQRQQGSADLLQQLASRGIVASGALGAGEQSLQKTYDTATTDAVDKLNQFIDTTTTDTTSQLGKLLAARNQTEADARLRYQTDPMYQPVGETTATQQASGLYQTPDGQWYDANHNLVQGPSLADQITAAISNSGGNGGQTPPPPVDPHPGQVNWGGMWRTAAQMVNQFQTPAQKKTWIQQHQDAARKIGWL